MDNPKRCPLLSTGIIIHQVDYPLSPHRTMEEAASGESDRQYSELARLPTLHLSRNGTRLAEISLDACRLLIGRSEDNDICIPSSYVSRHHILLVRHGTSTILVDLNSANGTFVNSQRVKDCVLADDDEITVDLHSMFVRYSITYKNPVTTVHGTLNDLEPADVVIAKALADLGDLPGKGDTDFLPVLSENVPTVLGFIDDR